MTIDFDADLADMLDLDEHAVPCNYNGADFNGILNQEFIEVDNGTAGISSVNPVLFCQGSQVSGISHGDAVTIDSRSYVVVMVQPDSAGGVVLVLKDG